RSLEALGRTEEERLHRALGAAERVGDVAIREPVDPRQQQGGALLAGKPGHGGLEPPRELTPGGALLRGDRIGSRELRSLASLLGVAPHPDVHPQLALRAAELVETEVRRDREDPRRESALRTVAVAEAEDLHEHVLSELLGLRRAPDEPPRVLDD